MYTFKIIEWPEIQSLMDKPGFEENSQLVNQDNLVEIYGPNAYFVFEGWLEEVHKEEEEFEYEFIVETELTVVEAANFSVWAKNYEEAKEKAIEEINNGNVVFLDSWDVNREPTGKQRIFSEDNKTIIKDWK